MLLSRTCPACRTGGAQLRRYRYSQSEWVLKECRTCGFVFLENPPHHATLQSQFPWENTSWLQNEARRKSYSRGENAVRSAIRGIWSITNTVIRRDKHVSFGYRYFRQGWIGDLGCGLENFSPLPPSRKLLGIEISTRTVADARPIFESRGGRIIHADLLSGLQSLEAASCDGALIESYLEHKVQPAEVLRELSRVLRAGSAIILKLPNYACWNRLVRGKKWCGFRLLGHVNYFTPDTLQALLEQQGFEIVRFTFLDRLWTNDNMWCVARKKEH